MLSALKASASRTNRAMSRSLDLITMGRTLVDIYGHQVGCRLEETSSFSKYVGGCPANIAIGVARLGLRVGHITRVGQDHHGRFLREQLEREGVDTMYVRTDPARLTAVAFLGIRDKQTFPMMHYRENCADMAIAPADYAADYIGRARALLVSGSHLTTPEAAANLDHAIDCARRLGTRVVFDIDFRPLFWKLVPKDAGESRFVDSAIVTLATQRVLSRCDLVVGTEEEIHIAGGALETVEALRNIRALTDATLVLKRGPLGCAVFPGAIPKRLEEGVVAEGFPVEIFNVVGAGDGFLAGFLSGWIPGLPLEDCCRRGNACGALVVSRHGCSPASPTDVELTWFLEHATGERRLHDNPVLERLHRATTRRARAQPALLVACDRENVAGRTETAERPRARWMALVAQLVSRLRAKEAALGLILDSFSGEDALFAAESSLDWVVRRINVPGTAMLQFEGRSSACAALRAWPQHQIVACRIASASGEAATLQHERLRELQHAVDMWGHELMLVLEAGNVADADLAEAIAAQVEVVQARGVQPDWWGFPSLVGHSAWQRLEQAARRTNEFCRGLLAFEPEDGDDGFADDLRELARHPYVRGVVVGRSILARPVRDWTDGLLNDSQFALAVKARIEGFRAGARKAA